MLNPPSPAEKHPGSRFRFRSSQPITSLLGVTANSLPTHNLVRGKKGVFLSY
jgi:hypothetical protein